MNASIDVPKIAMAVALQMMLCMIVAVVCTIIDDDMPPLCSFYEQY